MCGICGFIRLRGTPLADGDDTVVRRMVASLHHRGPDEAGQLVRAGVALANARLSIIDVADGHQPVHNEEGTVHVVFNGEIYNHGTLRDGLMHRGHRFASRADTEVLAHLYEEESVDFLQQLNGMFAIALWDEGSRRVLLGHERTCVRHVAAGARSSGDQAAVLRGGVRIPRFRLRDQGSAQVSRFDSPCRPGGH